MINLVSEESISSKMQGEEQAFQETACVLIIFMKDGLILVFFSIDLSVGSHGC